MKWLACLFCLPIAALGSDAAVCDPIDASECDTLEFKTFLQDAFSHHQRFNMVATCDDDKAECYCQNCPHVTVNWPGLGRTKICHQRRSMCAMHRMHLFGSRRLLKNYLRLRSIAGLAENTRADAAVAEAD